MRKNAHPLVMGVAERKWNKVIGQLKKLHKGSRQEERPVRRKKNGVGEGEEFLGGQMVSTGAVT